jgi:hypothetical protein
MRAHASWGLTPAELFPAPALSSSYPRTPRLRPRASRAPAELASPFSGLNGHAARLTLPRASATSRPPLPAKCHGVLLAKFALTPDGAILGVIAVDAHFRAPLAKLPGLIRSILTGGRRLLSGDNRSSEWLTPKIRSATAPAAQICQLGASTF